MRKFSAFALLAALLCFAPSLVAQGTLNSNSGSAVLSQTSMGLLVLTLGPERSDKNGNNGCRHDAGCKAVPEGGATVSYLGLAGLCCFAAVVYTIRRRGQISQTN